MHDRSVFDIRLTTPAGLLLAVAVWILNQRRPVTSTVSVGDFDVGGLMSTTSQWFVWTPSIPMNGPETTFKGVTYGSDDSTPSMHLPDAAVRTIGLRTMAVQIDYWLVCLTFLLATVSTSRRRWPGRADIQMRETSAEKNPGLESGYTAFGPSVDMHKRGTAG